MKILAKITTLFLLVILSGLQVHSQSSKDFAVYARVEVNRAAPSLCIKWPKLTDVVNYQIYRKGKTESTWGTIKATVNGTDTMWTDTDIAIGIEYEYYIIKTKADLSNGFTYLLGGIDIPVVHSRGNVLVVVEKTLSDSLSTELNSYYKDLAADGWNVYSITVNKTDSIQTVRRAIQQKDAQLGGLKSLIILGHVPVPYSGNFAPDGHGDHAGVWPTDAYYAIDYNNWADATYKVTGITRTENQNLPNDGKYDNTTLPGVVKYQTGRIDLSNMSKFSKSEIQLTKQYLKKDHDFRYKITKTVEKGIVDDNFSFTLGAFGSTGWRDFSVMFGANNVSSQDYFTACRNENILFAYGAGGGTYQSADGIGNTDSFTTQKGAIFNMLFGSYFGDWDNANNFLRAPLAAAENGLTSAWSGRPYWVNHAMALGEPIGNSVITTQNNKGTYKDNLYKNTVPIGLMGDPTLRLHIVAPPSNVKAVDSESNIKLSWTASSDSGIIGYNIYRSNAPVNNYTLLNSSPVTGNSYSDNSPNSDTNYYFVKSLKLTKSASGTYFNLSQGAEVSTYEIIENVKPSVLTKNATIYLDDNGLASINANDIDNGSYAKFEITSLTLSKYTFDCNDLGNNSVSLTVTDANGNVSSQSANIEVFDTTKATVILKNISVSIVMGKASITANDIDSGSFDNCAISSIVISKSDFNCDNIGDNTVEVTVVDGSGNVSYGTTIVTINGTTPMVSIEQLELPEFTQGNYLILNAKAQEPANYEWSTNETSSSINVSSSGNYSVNVSNANGCSSSASIYVNYDASSLMSSYSVIVLNEAILTSSSVVKSGSVGSMGSNGKVEVNTNSLITASGTFAKAKTIVESTGGKITNQYDGNAVQVNLPEFISNPFYSQGKDITIKSNAKVTLDDTIYHNIVIGSGAKVTFSAKVIYANSITTARKSSIIFNENCKVMLTGASIFEESNVVNLNNKSVVFYSSSSIKIKKGTSFYGVIYTKDKFEALGANSLRVSITGMIIAQNIYSAFTDINDNNLYKYQSRAILDNPGQPVSDHIDNEVVVYPNPTAGKVTVKLNANYIGSIKVNLCNAAGETLKLNTVNGIDEISLDLENYTSGIYFIKIQYADKVRLIRVIKGN